jgi:hypothetical protein
MRRTAKQLRQRRFALIALLGMMAIAAVFIWLDLPAPADQRGLSGSMFAGNAPWIDWENGGDFHSLDDPFLVRWRADDASEAGAVEPVRLFASRSDAWNPAACDLGVLEGSSTAPDAKRFAPRTVPCLNAGSWHLFAVQGSEVLHAFEDRLDIANGAAALERVGQSAETAFNGEIDVQLQLHRPAAEDGFDGVRDLPVDIWITDGKQVCVASAPPVSAPRDPVRSGSSWKSSQHASRVALASFEKVAAYSPFGSDADVPMADGMERKGRCELNEGTYRMVVGPTERAWVNEGSFFVHAPPATIDEDVLRITVPAGEVAETSLRVRNASS